MKNRSKVYYCDKFELLLSKNSPHLYNKPFWHADGSPAIPVRLVWSKASTKALAKAKRDNPTAYWEESINPIT